MNITLFPIGIILFIEFLMILDLQDLKHYLFITGLRFGRFNMVVEESSEMNLTLLAYIFKRLI